jgi:hypothetical protein
MYSSYKKQQVLHEGWRRYIKEEAPAKVPAKVPAIGQMQTAIADYKEKGCMWDYENSTGMKVFFDITTFLNKNQTGFGQLIIAGNTLANFMKGKIKGATASANHVGIIFSDGSIFHATRDDTGVSFQPSIPDMLENPHQYIILDLGGDENKLRAACQDLLKELSQHIDPSKAYDDRGIARQIPIVGKLLAHLPFAKEQNEYSYYCSELVANVLVRAEFMKAEELASRVLSEQLGAADELSPTELYDLISSKAKLIKSVCKTPQAQQQAQTEPVQPTRIQQPRIAKPERFFESKK